MSLLSINAAGYTKYPEITEWDHQKFIEYYTARYPELVDQIPYAIFEKIDGTNIQLYFQPGLPLQVGSRDMWLDGDHDLFGAYIFFTTFDFTVIQAYVDTVQVTLRLFVEYYGRGIMKGINYGDAKYFQLFDIARDDQLLPYIETEALVPELEMQAYLIPKITLVNTLDEALNYNCEFTTRYSHTDYTDDPTRPKQYIAEGIVIKPYTRHFVILKPDPEHGGLAAEYFMLKKKPEWRLKKLRAPGEKVKTEKPVDAGLMTLRDEFLTYLTDDRVRSVISHVGEPAGKQEIGKYIKLVQDDAKTEFLKEHPDLPALSADDWKVILSGAGNVIRPLLMPYLGSGF